MKTIKTKQSIQNIKTKNSNDNLKHFIKQQSIHNRQYSMKDDQDQQETNTASNATNQITTTAKATANEAGHRVRKYTEKKYQEQRIRKRTLNQKEQLMDLPEQANAPMPSQHPVPAMDNLTPKASYVSQAKSYVQSKIHTSKIKGTAEHIITAPFVQKTSQFVTTTSEIIRKTASGMNTLISLGTGLILVIVMTLFIGTFSVLAQDGGSNSLIQPLSDEVLAYEDTIRKYAEEHGIEDYVAILEAIMMQESKGLGNDPMQCSESGFNTKYPRVPNGITDPEYSIECGVKTFADCLSQTGITDKSDTEKLYLAIQGYNYGDGYITWALSNFGSYTKYNAQLFSDNMKTQLNTDVYGDPNYVDHVMQYVPVTFRGGTDPNFNNTEAWITKNPYAPTYYGQCTWFAWGRFYELYGFDPGFRGNGWDCVNELVAVHPDRFERSLSPKAGSVFSGIGVNHVGIVIAVDEDYVTIQEGNLDGKTNTFQDAKTDWHAVTYTLDQLRSYYKGVVFANPLR